MGIRECSFLGVPVVNIGSRQEGRERGKNVIDVDYESTAIQTAVLRQISMGRYKGASIYGDGKAGANIADLLGRVKLSISKKMTY